MRYSLFTIYIMVFMSFGVVSGQYYDTGQDPASLKWKQIKTDRFTVIYPEKYDSGGIAYARSLNEAYYKFSSLFPEKKFRIPVVIHNFTTHSNGYVAWAPKRMELYPTPDQNTIPLAPEKQLAIHELTHVLQLESLNKGFTRAMSFILGEQFTGIVASLLPLWFFEGEAVFAESAFTGSGRGRLPSFQKEIKAIIIEQDRFYKYDKVLNGSYRDHVPDHYQSGYQMVTWALTKYDTQIWNKVLNNTADQPFSLNPVNISLLKTAGLTKKRLYKETFDSLNTIWTKELSENKTILYEPLNPGKKEKYINYYSPVPAGTDTVFAIKTSLSAPPAFVLVNLIKKTEKTIHIPGQMYPWVFSYAGGKLVWVETEHDKRWENRDYSVIKLLDIESKRTTRLSRKSRYLAASVSPDGHKIAAIENTYNNRNSVVFIDAETGNILQSVKSPGNAYLLRPQWAEGGEKLTVIYLTDAGEGIMSYSLTSQNWETLIEADKEDLQSSYLRNDSLFFISSLSGTDNIYLRTSDRKIALLTRSRFGVTDLTLKGEKLLFSDYTSLGNNICSTTIEGTPVTGTKSSSSASFLINRFNLNQQATGFSSENKYIPDPYRKWQHLFRFHSWMPFYADIQELKTDPLAVRPGISILTQNQLSTLISSIGYEYSAEKNHLFHSRITWKGWYPVFESQFDYGDDPLIEKMGTTAGNPSEILPGLRFSNTVSLPLRFSSGKFTEYLRPSITSEYRNKYIFITQDGAYDYGQTILSGKLFFSNYYRSAIRDIYPRWAQAIELNYSFAPFDKLIYGTAVTVKSSFYFPGIFPGNAIKIRLEKEKQNPTKFMFSNRISFPRGYDYIISKDMELLSVDYVLPLAYPDFNISSLLYLKRIRTGLFYDYASGTGNYHYSSDQAPVYMPDKEIFRSYGFELLADFHVLRIPFMISGGVQTTWKTFSKMPSFELLLNIDLFGMSIGREKM